MQTHTPDLAFVPNPRSVAAARTRIGSRRRQFQGAGYAIVGLVALGLGVGGTLLYQRNQQPGVPPVTESDHAGHAVDGEPDSGATRGGAVFISPARQRLIGVRTTEATHQTVERGIRTVGTLAVDETRQAQVHTKIAGWAEQVTADFVGKPVRKGQALFTIYSPELVATQKEYLLALRARREFADSEFAETRESSERLVAAARERLKLWDVTDSQIARLETTGEVQRTIAVFSPVSGVVTERSIYPGQYVTPQLMAFKIADLSRVWAIGEVFEYELPFIQRGQPVTVEFPSNRSAARLTGKVAFIYPEVDPQTRRGRIRVDFPNPGMTLKPGTFVTLVVGAPAETALVVPREAVIDTGTRRYVILATDRGLFEPRAVTVGTPAGEVVPVLSGLSHGDRVVTSAQFLVDSETNLQAAMTAMAGHGHAVPDERGQADAAPQESRDHSNHQQH